MEFMVRRLIEASIIANRADADWIRHALTLEREDLKGSVTGLDPTPGRLFDDLQRWPFNMYGRFTSDGNSRPGERLVMLDGAAAGSDWEIVSAVGKTIDVVDGNGDPVDLALAGVAEDDCYEIRVGQYEKAVEWFARTALRVIIGWPQDPQTFPCFAITLAGSSEVERPIGDRARTNSGKAAAGPVVHEIHTKWREGINITMFALTPEQAVWMYRVMEYAYRSSVRFLDSVFFEGLLAQGAELTERMDIAAKQVFVRTFTISGIVEKTASEEEQSWLQDNLVPATTNLEAWRAVATSLPKG